MMTSDLYAHLRWLPRPHGDFRAHIRDVRSSADAWGPRVRDLAAAGLDSNQLVRLADVIGEARRTDRSLDPLEPLRLGIVSNSTTDFIVPAIIGTGARYGFAIECVVAGHGQAMQTALDPRSAVNGAACDVILVALDASGLPLESRPGDCADSAAALDQALANMRAIRRGFAQNSHATVVYQTVARPAETLLGSLDATLAGSMAYQVAGFNRGLAEQVSGSTDRLLDIAGLAETVGLANWHDPVLWNMAKQPFSPTFVPLYAEHVCRLIAAIRGRSKKVLVLDLDNTVWGGVIGDDGIDGIKIGQGDATGEAHLALQRYALAMRDRGVVLAVSSKNTDSVARHVFKTHPDMVLRERHIAVFQANWNDKATNIQSIATALSLGVDSFVFVDDNPVERDLVRRMLPRVAVPELPADPAMYVRTIAAAGYFETAAFSDEDRTRAEFYADNARRAALKPVVGDITEYLRTLSMMISFKPFDMTGKDRIAQLINKSNQYNLTTRRYTEREVVDLISDPDVYSLQVRLKDAFGDNGMISVVICRRVGEDWEIDTWLMSCRVLGRGVEMAVLEEVIAQANQQGIRQLIGVYKPTSKNGLVRNHYERLGFARLAGEDGKTTTWAIAADTNVAATEGLFTIMRD